MNKRSLILFPLLLSMVACTATAVMVNAERKTIDFDNLPANTFTPTSVGGELGDFDLVSPTNGAHVESVGEFSWNASANADTYTLEICSDDRFISTINRIDYYKRDNIRATSFTINSILKYKDQNYYWRVTAVNSTGTKVSTSVFTFYIEAPEVNEYSFDIGDADDWSLHPTGSYADISIDSTNFFKNDKDSLVVTFKEEDTNHGPIESVGWIIVTKTIEKNIYGTDSLMFDMYYSGQDSSIFVRVIDEDNEFWHIPVKVSNNVKQKVVVKFDDFEQRTRDVTVGNMTFDYNHIKYFEIVFEKTFGDGVLLMSDIKAIKYESYKHMFIDKLDFEEYDVSAWADDTCKFDKTINGTELMLHHSSSSSGAPSAINGYGFAKLNVNKYFAGGDAVKVKVKYNGSTGNNILIRIYEEDDDRWSYKVPYNQLTEDEYMEFVIPYQAFAKSYIGGSGKREFYYIKNLQFGAEGQYGNGNIFFKDFEIVYKEDYQTEKARDVGANGLIEDFNNYPNTASLYMIWQASDVNKDEYMAIDSTNKLGGKSNPFCGQFLYKADMEPAKYGIPVKMDANGNNFSSISLWMRDSTVRDSDPKYSYLGDNVSPKTTIHIYLGNGAIFGYTMNSLEKVWTNYVIPFKDFKLLNPRDVTVVTTEINPEAIAGVGFEFQYFYYDAYGKAEPSYHDDDPVFIDNIKFGTDTEFAKESLVDVIHQVDGIALVDDFEKYVDTDALEEVWQNGKSYEYQKKTLSSVVSSEGGNHSMAMQFKTKNESPSYAIAPVISSDVTAKGIKFSIKGEKSAEVFLNFYLRINGSVVQYRATVVASSNWVEYSLGFGDNNFKLIAGGSAGRSLTTKDLVSVYQITFGMVYSGGEESELANIYVDNIKFDASLTYSTKNSRTIDA